MADKIWNAQSYSENSQLQYEASKKFFGTLLLKGDELILDIGCGTGLLTSEIAKKVPNGKVIGFDSSEDMISYANKHSQSSNLTFQLMRAEEFAFPFKFDVIISSFCIHWIKDKQALLHQIAAHLHPHGQTRIIMPFRHEGIAKIRHSLMTQEKWSPYFDTKIADELLIFDNAYDIYAQKTALDNLKFETEEVTTIFENVTKFKDFLKNIISSLHELPTAKLQDEFLQAIVTLYLKTQPILADGSCSITYTYGRISSQGIK